MEIGTKKFDHYVGKRRTGTRIPREKERQMPRISFQVAGYRWIGGNSADRNSEVANDEGRKEHPEKVVNQLASKGTGKSAEKTCERRFIARGCRTFGEGKMSCDGGERRKGASIQTGGEGPFWFLETSNWGVFSGTRRAQQ